MFFIGYLNEIFLHTHKHVRSFPRQIKKIFFSVHKTQITRNSEINQCATSIQYYLMKR